MTVPRAICPRIREGRESRRSFSVPTAQRSPTPRSRLKPGLGRGLTGALAVRLLWCHEGPWSPPLPDTVRRLVAHGFPGRCPGLCVLACSGDSGSGPPSTKVKDALGRNCTVQDAAHVTCDQAPHPMAGCPAGATPCWALGTTGNVTGPGAICASCCSGNTSSGTAADCSSLVCSTDMDCPDVYGRCMSGACRY
jgi:hypothetical protein